MAKGRYRNLDATRIALLLGKEPANRLRVPLCRFEPDTQEESAMANKQIEIDEDQAALVAALQKARADEGEIEKAIGPKTRAVMIVPVYGNPCAMDAIVEICRRRNLILIEDCCEALGAYYDGKAVGKFGRVGTFSF